MLPVRITVRIDPEYYTTIPSGNVELFLPKSVCRGKIHSGEISRGKSEFSLEVDVPREVHPNTPFFLHWYTDREHRDESIPCTRSPNFPYRSFAGSAYLTAHEIRFGGVATLLDSDKQRVGRMRMAVSPCGVFIDYSLLESKFPSHISFDTDRRRALREELILSDRETIAATQELKETNVSALQRSNITSIRLPIGSVPPWVWTIDLYGCITEKHQAASERMMLGLLQIASRSFSFSWGTDGVPSSAAGKAEFIAELVGTPVRYMLYIADSSRRKNMHDEGVDEWARIAHHRGVASNFMSMDCEDGTFHTLEINEHLRRTRFTNPILKSLQELELLYTPLFAIGTITSSCGATYHAFVLKLDKRWLLEFIRTGLPPISGEFLPPVMIETTCYVQACWAFYSQKDERSVSGEGRIATAIEARWGNVYHELVCAFPCELAHEMGIARLDFSESGRQGMSISRLLSGRHADMRVHVTARGPDLVHKARQLMDCMPAFSAVCADPRSAVTGITKELVFNAAHKKRAHVPSSRPDYDMFFREMDFSMDQASAFCKSNRFSCMHLLWCTLPAGGSGVRARFWS